MIKQNITKNRNSLIKFVLIITILLLIIILVGCSKVSSVLKEQDPLITTEQKPSVISEEGVVKTNNEGEVTIDVRYLGFKENSISFEIVMDTHSIDLDQYDLGQLSLLKDNKGNEYRPVSWDSKAGGHHRSGNLTFSLTVLADKINKIELTIQNIAGIKERVFEWQVNINKI